MPNEIPQDNNAAPTPPPVAPQNPGVPREEFESMKNILWAAVIIMLLMVGNMLIDSWNNKGASYYELTTQVIQQNAKIDMFLQKK